MKVERLENIAEVIAGQSPPSETYNQINDGLPFFQGNADFGDMFPTARYWCTAPVKIALPNDILMTVRAPVGPVNICNIESCIGRGLSAIRVNDNHFYKYVYYFLKSHERQIAKLGVGSTFKAITQKDIRGLQIPLPEKYEDQIRIANTLSKAEALIKQRKVSINLLDEFLKSTFLDMFGDPVRNENKWDSQSLGQLCEFENGDRSSNYPSGNEIKEDGIIFINSGNIVDFRFSPINPNFISVDKFNTLRSGKCYINDILFTLRGNGLGKCCVFNGVYEKGFINAQLVIIRPNENLNPFFLIEQFRNSSMFQNIWKLQSGSAQPQLSVSQLKHLKIALPPIYLQTQFAQIVEKTETLKSQFQESLYELQNLFGSLSQQAFKGELDLDKMEIHSEILDKAIILEKDITSKLNPAMITFIEKVDELDSYFEADIYTERDKIKMKSILSELEILFKSINTSHFLSDEVLNKIERFEFLKNAKILSTFIQNHEKIKWEDVSTQHATDLIKEKYTGFHFTTEMLFRFFNEEHLIYPHYFSSEELKTNPQLHSADDLKSIVFSAINNENPFLKLEQVFYNGDIENFTLNITPEDYELIKKRSKEERSGIYFTVVS